MKNVMEKVVNKVNNGMMALSARVKGYTNNEKGVSTIEWVGLAAVIVALMFAIASAMDGQGGGIASAIVSKISSMISEIGN
ncbi:hypothetical protein ACLM5H_16155 [Fredinandcohnia humi]